MMVLQIVMHNLTDYTSLAHVLAYLSAVPDREDMWNLPVHQFKPLDRLHDIIEGCQIIIDEHLPEAASHLQGEDIALERD